MNRKQISVLRLLTQITYFVIFILALVSHYHAVLFITISAFLLGSVFCGWMCFMGTYQDICRYLGKFIKKKPLELSEKVHNILKYSRYLILVGSLAIGSLFLFPGEVRETTVAIIRGHAKPDIVLLCFIFFGVLSLFTKRFFCRYCCAYGAKLGLFSLFRLITINRKNTCISCQLCHKECPMNIRVDKINSLATPNCINCLRCVECCPNNSLKIGLRNYLKP